VLGDGDDHRLVVRRRVDRADAVGTRGDTSGDGRGQDAVDTRIIDTLEENKLLGVVGGDLVDRREGLNDKVRVADDLSLGVEELG